MSRPRCSVCKTRGVLGRSDKCGPCHKAKRVAPTGGEARPAKPAPVPPSSPRVVLAPKAPPKARRIDRDGEVTDTALGRDHNPRRCTKLACACKVRG